MIRSLVKTDMRCALANLVVTTSLLFYSSLAAADDAAAATVMFEKGLANMKAGNYDAGCKELAESVRLDRKPGALYTLAQCELEWGRLATAMARYEEFLRLYDKLSDAERPRQEARAKKATEQRDKLALEVSRWTITLAPNTPPDTVVRRNGDVIGAAMLGVEIPVDPGTYVLTTQVSGGPVKEQRIDVTKGVKLAITLDIAQVPMVGPTPVVVEPPRPVRVDQPVTNKRGESQRTGGWITLGTGGILLVGGAIAGVVTIANKAEVDEHCGSGVGFSKATQCNDEGRTAGETARVSSTVANAGFIAGAIGIGAGVLIVLTAPKTIAPTKEKLVPRLEGDVSASRSGAVVLLRGTW